MRLHSFSRAWDIFLEHIQDSWLNDHRSITATALRCLEKAVKACTAADSSLRSQTLEALDKTWIACDTMGAGIVKADSLSPNSQSQESDTIPIKPYTQECFVALVDVIRSAKSASRDLEQAEWSLEKLARLMSILKGE